MSVHHLEVARFVYLVPHSERIKDTIDTITSKAALILGRFTDARRVVLAGRPPLDRAEALEVESAPAR